MYFLHVRERTFESKIILQKPKDASLSTGRIIILLGLRQVAMVETGMPAGQPSHHASQTTVPARKGFALEGMGASARPLSHHASQSAGESEKALALVEPEGQPERCAAKGPPSRDGLKAHAGEFQKSSRGSGGRQEGAEAPGQPCSRPEAPRCPCPEEAGSRCQDKGRSCTERRQDAQAEWDQPLGKSMPTKPFRRSSGATAAWSFIPRSPTFVSSARTRVDFPW